MDNNSIQFHSFMIVLVYKRLWRYCFILQSDNFPLKTTNPNCFMEKTIALKTSSLFFHDSLKRSIIDFKISIFILDLSLSNSFNNEIIILKTSFIALAWNFSSRFWKNSDFLECFICFFVFVWIVSSFSFFFVVFRFHLILNFPSLAFPLIV